MKAARIVVTGKVQGVYFRATAKQVAQEYNIRGWCMNKPTGEVEIFAQGWYKNLNEFFKWCNNGPEMAEVEKVEVEFVEPESFESFQIRY